MGAKSSKAAVVIDPSITNTYDTFSNYQDTDTDTYRDTSGFFYLYSIIIAIVFVYNMILYSFIYLRRRTKYSYK